MVGREDECILELDNTERRSEPAYIQATGAPPSENTARDRVCLMLNPDVKHRASNSSLHFQMLSLVPVQSYYGGRATGLLIREIMAASCGWRVTSLSTLILPRC